MSYGFGTTLGTATTDRIQLSITPTTGQRTYAFRGKINGPGGGTNGLGRFLDAEPNTSNTEAWFREASTNRIIYNRAHTTQNGAWYSSCPSDVTGEHTYGISVDGSGTSAPVMYFDGVSQLVTVGTAPIGGAQTNTSPIFLGNRSPDWGRGYDGTQRGWGFWNTILTPQEHLDFHNGCDPRYDAGWTSGHAPTGYVAFIPMEVGDVDPDGVIVAVTGAQLIVDATGPYDLVGANCSQTATSGTGNVSIDGVYNLIGSDCSQMATSGTGAITTDETVILSPVDRGNIALASSSVTNATSTTPTVTMQVRRMVNEQSGDAQAKNYFFYGATSKVNGKTPTFKMKFWSSSSHSTTTELFKFHYATPLDARYKPVWSYDGRDWNYFDHCAWNADGLHLDFYNDTAFSSETVYFASAFPWQTDRTAEWISSLSSAYLSQTPSAVAFGGDPYQIGLTTSRSNELGETIAPCKVYALKISSGGLDPNSHTKRKIVLVAGTHSGEDLGNWVLKGCVEFLLSEDAKAQLARQWCDFYVYPMTDPSGRRGGHWRSHFDTAKLTADGNRYWGLNTLANTDMHVAAILADTGGAFSVSMDFHSGHATAPYYVTQTQTSNDTWHTAIQTYISGITRSIGDIAGSMMGWAENTIGAKICITPEFNCDNTYTTSQIETWGANHMKALADVAATNYLYTVPTYSLAGANCSQAATSGTGAVSYSAPGEYGLIGSDCSQAATSSAGSIEFTAPSYALIGANCSQSANSGTGEIFVGLSYDLIGAGCSQSSLSGTGQVVFSLVAYSRAPTGNGFTRRQSVSSRPVQRDTVRYSQSKAA